MDFYILTYQTVDNFIAKRQQYRSDHLFLVKKYYADDILLMGGALTNPDNEALLIFKTSDVERIKTFVSNDPYVKNGLINNWTIRKWNVAIGDNAN